MYLVLWVCRACNHHGTAKRPSTPSHSASRHSIFFSPRPSSLRSFPPVPGHHFSRGPTTLPYLFFFSRRSSLPLHVASRRCAHSVIIIRSRSWTDADSLFPFSLQLCVSLFVSLALVYSRISRPNSIALHYRLTDEVGSRTQRDVRQLFRQLPSSPGSENLRKFIITETRANIRSCTNSPTHSYLRWIFNGLL